MSCEIETIVFTEIREVRIKNCNAKEIANLEEAMTLSLNQKIDKLNILIKNCNVYSDGKNILVNDNFCICNDLIDVAKAFGLSIKKIACNLKGHTYIISDELIGLIKQFGKDYFLGEKTVNKEIDNNIRDILNNNGFSFSFDKKIFEMIQNIKLNGEFVAKETRVVTQTDYGYLITKTANEWTGETKSIKSKLLAVSKNAQDVIANANKNLRDGTTKLIYSRARKMGYSVQEVKQGSKIQLVLVRCD